jgi:KaiC/GvpD/RAD55 family RecA-like ATPase
VPAQEPATKRIPLQFSDELEQYSEPCDFVENLLCDQQLSVLYGEPNIGKTFLAIDLALHVSLGWPWQGLEVDRGGVVFIAGEGASGARQRYKAFRQHHGREKTAGASFAVVPRAVNFCDKASVAGLISSIKDAASRFGERVRLVIVDTLSRALAGGDENSSVEMGMVVNAADRVRLATGAHVMFIHHTGKDPTKGARGHSLLRGNVDTEIAIERGEGERTAIARVEKQRDLECGRPLSFRLHQVRLGTNRRGKPITSCVVENVPMPRPKLSENASTCLAILNELLPEDVSDVTQALQNGVEIDAWREAVMQRLKEGALQGVANPSTLRSKFSRAKEELLSHGYITISGNWVDTPW